MGSGSYEDTVLVGGSEETFLVKWNVKLKTTIPFGLDFLDKLKEDLVEVSSLFLLSFFFFELVFKSGFSGPWVIEVLVIATDLSNELDVVSQLFLNYNWLT